MLFMGVIIPVPRLLFLALFDSKKHLCLFHLRYLFPFAQLFLARIALPATCGLARIRMMLVLFRAHVHIRFC